MKAIKTVDKKPVLVDLPSPAGDGVKVKVVSASICGSDIHMMAAGFFGDNTIGHEFAGVTENGKAVAIEPLGGCGHCDYCDEGHAIHCVHGFSLLGVHVDGGMAEYVNVPASSLVELPSGLDVRNASLIEPLAVAVQGVERARVREGDRVLVIGAGPIGLAVGAVLSSRGMPYDIVARYEHQQNAAERLGASCAYSGCYDVVMDAVGSASSLKEASEYVKPMGRIGLVGMFWEPTDIDPGFCVKEVELISAAGYRCKNPGRSFEEATKILFHHSHIVEALISHRYPLDGVSDAFDTASNRAAGAIKVVFDVASPTSAGLVG